MKRPLLLTIIASFVLPACGAARDTAFAAASPASPPAAMESAGTMAAYPAASPGQPMAAMAPMAPMAAAPPPAPARGATTASSASTSAIPAASVHAPLVTYSGELALRVDRDPAAAIDAIITAAESLGGYLASRRDASVEVRVPSARFREAMTKVAPMGEVTHRSVSATDVSDEFHDAEVRLANLRATRNRLQELLAKTGSLGDTLTVERELERVAQEIDRLE